MNESITSFRHPEFADGAGVYQLVKSSPPLDVNSQYYYHIICSDFRDTCVVAEIDGQIAGFLSAYLKPCDPDCLFVWQVVVAESARGRGLASDMLEWLFKQPKCTHIKCLETTISPSNQASQKLFRRFAEKHGAECLTFPFLDVSHFGDSGHEDEILFRITPLD